MGEHRISAASLAHRQAQALMARVSIILSNLLPRGFFFAIAVFTTERRRVGGVVDLGAPQAQIAYSGNAERDAAIEALRALADRLESGGEIPDPAPPTPQPPATAA